MDVLVDLEFGCERRDVRCDAKVEEVELAIVDLGIFFGRAVP